VATDYFSGLLDDEEKKKEAGAVASEQPQGGGESAIVQGAQEPAQPGQGTKSGSFTNLQSYLDANESSKFGKQLAGQVEGDSDYASNVQNKADQEFKSRADSSAVGLNQNIISRLNSDPVSLAKDNAAKSEFYKMRDARYQGPKNFSDAQDLYSETNQATAKAGQSAKLANDESGRKTLLDDYYGTGAGKYDYTSGQKKLDNYLVQVDPNSREYFAGAKQKADAVGSNFNRLSETLNQYGTTKANETAEARRSARGAIGLGEDNTIQGNSPINTILAQAKQRASELNAQKSGAYSKALEDLRNRNESAAAKFGIAPDRALYGADLSAYLRQANNIDYNQAATPQEQAKIAALAELAGVDNTYLPYADRAGRYDINNIYDVGGLDSYINSKKGELDIYQQEANARKKTLQDKYDQINNSAQFSYNPNYLPEYSKGEMEIEKPTLLQRILENMGEIDKDVEKKRVDMGYYDTLNKALSGQPSPGGIWGQGRIAGGR